MRSAAPVLVVLLLAAGCAGPEDGSTTTTSPTPPPSPTAPPKPTQVFSAQGNNDQCTEALVGEKSYSFTVNATYDQIEVEWHATGVGQVGFAIADPKGALVTGEPDYNPGTPPPCTHQHGAGGTRFPAMPGEYSVTVRNQGLVGWMLVVVARSSQSNATGHAGH